MHIPKIPLMGPHQILRPRQCSIDPTIIPWWSIRWRCRDIGCTIAALSDLPNPSSNIVSRDWDTIARADVVLWPDMCV